LHVRFSHERGVCGHKSVAKERPGAPSGLASESLSRCR